MIPKDKMTWFYTIDKHLWGDKIKINQYLSTTCLMLAGLWGAVVAVIAFISSSPVNKETIGIILEPLLLLWVTVVGESIIGSSKIYVAILRSILFCFAILFLFTMGVVLSVIVIFAIAFWLFAIILLSILKGGFSSTISQNSSSENEEYITGDYGEKITLDKNITGNYRGNDGHDYENLGGGYVRRKNNQ